MRTLQLTATVTPNHELLVQLPPEIAAGNYQIVLVLEEQPIQEPQKQRQPSNLCLECGHCLDCQVAVEPGGTGLAAQLLDNPGIKDGFIEPETEAFP